MKLGPVQSRLLRRAYETGRVMPANYLERRALRRLQSRGIAHKVWACPDVWEVKW